MWITHNTACELLQFEKNENINNDKNIYTLVYAICKINFLMSDVFFTSFCQDMLIKFYDNCNISKLSFTLILYEVLGLSGGLRES